MEGGHQPAAAQLKDREFSLRVVTRKERDGMWTRPERDSDGVWWPKEGGVGGKEAERSEVGRGGAVCCVGCISSAFYADQLGSLH